MKLQKQLSRRYAGRDYAKWTLVIPPDLIETLGWTEGDEIEPLVQRGELRLHRARQEAA